MYKWNWILFSKQSDKRILATESVLQNSEAGSAGQQKQQQNW